MVMSFPFFIGCWFFGLLTQILSQHHDDKMKFEGDFSWIPGLKDHPLRFADLFYYANRKARDCV